MGGVNQIFIEVPANFTNYLVCEVADPFIIASLLPALINGENIECESVSDDLYYHSKTIIFLLSKVFNKPIIKLIPKEIKHLDFCPTKVGTGFSGGIDSLSTFINHTSEECPESYKINQLALFNVGSYGNNYEKTKEKFQKDIIRAQEFAKEVDLPL